MFELLGGVTVREPTADDAAAVVEAVRASLPELRPWMPWAHDEYGLEDAAAWIRGDFGDGLRFLLFEPDGRVVGCVGVNDLDERNRRGNLGYWVRSDCAGRGLASAAASWLARHAFETTDLERLEILMAVDNAPSRRVAEKVGAGYEGVARRRVRVGDVQQDAHVFGLVSSDLGA